MSELAGESLNTVSAGPVVSTAADLAARRRDAVLLRSVAVIYLATFAYHSVAHEVRGVTPPLTFWLGWSLQFAALVVVVMVFRDHRLAVPTLVVVSGASWFGLAVVHLLPAWGPMSEPWVHHHGISPVWWGSLWAALGGGLLANVVSLYVLRRERARSRRWSDLS
jgi:hypothetical protein